MVLEEMSELQKAILKNLNRSIENQDELIDETADVEIMLTQLKMIYGIEQSVAAHIPDKINRIKARLEG